MTKSIRTYDELLEEKQRLQDLLKVQRQQIRTDFMEIKEEIQPVLNVVKFLGKASKPDKSNPLLGTATNTVIDMLLKRVVLARAGWITRLLVPLVTKNLSTHYIADHKDQWLKKVVSLFGLKRRRPHVPTTVERQDQPIK